MSVHRPLRRDSGFSFIEILVVMGIIATLAGLGLFVVNIWQRRQPENDTKATLMKCKALIDTWKLKFSEYPPMRMKLLPRITGVAEPKFSSPNSDNEPIEALYQAFYVPGLGTEAELGDTEFANIDEDKLQVKITSRGVDLREIIDAWGNPLVYFVHTEYTASEKNPPMYSSTKEGTVEARPYKDPGGGFVNPNGFQIFSMGPDGKPNTDDDLLGW
jgi:prepilin-type N-terminal cleavage/methylation domain-containing protein